MIGRNFAEPNRDGTWSETGVLETSSSLWRIENPAGGNLSAADGPARSWFKAVFFVFDVELIKPVARERLHCFDEKTGKVLWVYAYEEKYGDWTYVPERGAGPTATPIVEGNRIYIVGANGNTHCLDVQNGAVVWEKNIGKEYTVAEMSCRPSPLIEGSLLIVFTGAQPDASVLALDKQTGKEVWKALDDPVSNSSPIIINVHGRRQLIVWSDSSVSSLAPADGHIYWREPMTTSINVSAATPVFQGNRLLISGLMLDVSSNAPRYLWPEIRPPSKRVLSNTSTPVLQGEYVYAAKGEGDLVCLEASTGSKSGTPTA